MGFDIAKVDTGYNFNSDEAIKAFETATQGGGRNPKLALKTAMSDACKAGDIPVNHYALDDGNDVLIDLGKEVPALVVAFRAFALDWSNKDAIVATADIQSDEFKRIKAVVDSNKKDSNCLFGPEFLVYLPNENRYANLLMAGWNAKLLGAKTLHEQLRAGKPALLKSGMKEGKHGKNWYPMGEPLKTAIDLSGLDEEEYKTQVSAFMEITKPALSVEDDER